MLDSKSTDCYATSTINNDDAGETAALSSAAVKDAKALAIERDPVFCDFERFRASATDTDGIARLGLIKGLRQSGGARAVHASSSCSRVYDERSGHAQSHAKNPQTCKSVVHICSFRDLTWSDERLFARVKACHPAAGRC